MGQVVGFCSAKGGVGKSTCILDFAVFAIKAGLKVLIGDMDFDQQSTMDWAKRRKALKVDPPIEVKLLTPEMIAKTRELVDLLLLDLPGHAGELTLNVAKQVDLMVVVTSTNMLELTPNRDLLIALRNEGYAAPRVAIVLTRVPDKQQEVDARAYLEAKDFEPLGHSMAYSKAVFNVGNSGKTPQELPYPDVASKARKFVEGIAKALQEATGGADEGRARSREPVRGGRGR